MVDHTLVLQDKVLSTGVCNGMRSVLTLVPHLLHHLYLSNNNMGAKETNLWLEGVLSQTGTFKTLAI